MRRFGGAKQLTLRYSVDSILIIAIKLADAVPVYRGSKIRYSVCDVYNLSSVSSSAERSPKTEYTNELISPTRFDRWAGIGSIEHLTKCLKITIWSNLCIVSPANAFCPRQDLLPVYQPLASTASVISECRVLLFATLTSRRMPTGHEDSSALKLVTLK